MLDRETTMVVNMCHGQGQIAMKLPGFDRVLPGPADCWRR